MSAKKSRVEQLYSVPSRIVERYFEDLPKRHMLGERIWSTIHSVAAIFGIVTFPFAVFPELSGPLRGWLGLPPVTDPSIIASFQDKYLVLLSVMAIAWALYRTVSTPRRASEEAYFSHLAMHTVRDFLAHTPRDPKDVDETLHRLLHTTEKAFTFVTKRKCVASIKSQTVDRQVKVTHTSDTVVYSVNAEQSYPRNAFSSIAYITDDDRRYFMSNDVWMDFRRQKYDHPKLSAHKETETFAQLRAMIKEYLRPPRGVIGFRSTLVVPIRAWRSGATSSSEDGTPHSPYLYFGFLCIDSTSRNAFKPRVITEIAATYADAMCVVFLEKQKLRPNAKTRRTE